MTVRARAYPSAAVSSERVHVNTSARVHAAVQKTNARRLAEGGTQRSAPLCKTHSSGCNMHAGINKWRRASDVAADRLSRMGMGGEGGVGGGGRGSTRRRVRGFKKLGRRRCNVAAFGQRMKEKRSEKRRGGLWLQVRTAE